MTPPSDSSAARDLSQTLAPATDGNSAVAFTALAVMDESLGRERRAGVLNFLRMLKAGPPRASVDVLQVSSITEDDLIKVINGKNINVLLLPWHKAISWRKLEGQLGLKRTQGTIVIGYFAEPVRPFELEYPIQGRRIALLDLHRTGTPQALALVRSMAINGIRSGLPGLFAMANQVGEASSSIFNAEGETSLMLSFRGCPVIQGIDWGEGTTLGRAMETVDRLTVLKHSPWSARKLEIREVLTALWTLVFEEGPGRSGFSLQQKTAAGLPLARFELAHNERLLTMRLHYTHPKYKSPDVLAAFWPNPKIPAEAGLDAADEFKGISNETLSSIHATAAPSRDFRMDRSCGLLHRYADFLRVLFFEETSRIEVIAGFLDTAPARMASDELHSICIEPISEHLFFENQSGAVAAVRREELALPRSFDTATVTGGGFTDGTASTGDIQLLQMKLRALEQQVSTLELEVKERDEKIEELRLGGVIGADFSGKTARTGGSAAASTGAGGGASAGSSLLGPDVETLLEALEIRFRDYEQQLSSLQVEISAAEIRRDPAQVGFLRDARRRITSLQIRRTNAIEGIRALATKLERSARPVKQ